MQKRHGQPGEVPKEGHKDDQRAGEPALQGKLKELGLFSLEKRRLRAGPRIVFQCLKGGYREDREYLFTRSHMEKTSGNGYKLQQERFHLNIRTKLFTVRSIIDWNNLPRDRVETPSLEVFNMGLDRVLGNLMEAPLPTKGWTR